MNTKKELILVEPTKRRNGILVKKTGNDLNSCELRKISLSGRDNGYVGSIAGSTGNIIISGTSWRPVKSFWMDFAFLQELVNDNWEDIHKIITQEIMIKDINIDDIKSELNIDDSDLSAMFDYKNTHSFKTSSAYQRILKGLVAFYKVVKTSHNKAEADKK